MERKTQTLKRTFKRKRFFSLSPDNIADINWVSGCWLGRAGPGIVKKKVSEGAGVKKNCRKFSPCVD